MDRGSNDVSHPEPQAPLTAEDAAKTPHHIVIVFGDDHTISGAKFDIRDVSPEQIAVAVYHLNRSAQRLSDMMELAARQNQSDVQRVMRDLAKGGRG